MLAELYMDVFFKQKIIIANYIKNLATCVVSSSAVYIFVIIMSALSMFCIALLSVLWFYVCSYCNGPALKLS
jgi:hypothetical protein